MAAWDISTAVYSQLFSITAQETTPTGVFFKPDGRKMYVIGYSGDDVNEYNLSTAWDISTAVYSQLFSVTTQTSVPQGLFFKPDGTKMYVVGSVGFPVPAREVYEYDLSTAWNVSTAVYSQLFSVAAQETAPSGLFFKPDGTKMYVIGYAGDDVNEYNLGTPWDISTAVYSQLFSVAAQETSPQGLFFKPDGTKMYVIGFTEDNVNEYDLSERWCSVASAVYSQNFSVAGEEINPIGVFFKPDGTKMYVIGFTGDDVNEYNLGTAWNVSTAVYLQNFSIAAQESNPQSVFFKPDGTKMYVIGSTGDDVNEYDLGTAWDVSTAVYSQNFSVAAQETAPTGVFFKPDGTKMYVIGSTGDDVNEYNLSTAWDVSTAVYLQNFSMAGEEQEPTGVFFKPDGTKMYVIGFTGDDVNEYNLGTAWNVSTAVYLQNFSIAAQESNPQSVFFRPDGRKMYVLGLTGQDINEYNLSCYLLRNPSMAGGMS